jgi:hypothetical protein
VEVVAVFRGSQELAAVLAAVTVGTGPEVSGTFSRLVSVRSSFDGVSAASGSSKVVSRGVVSIGSIGADSEIGTSSSFVGSTMGSSGFMGSVAL